MSNLPRVAAIHDISGFGRCALTVIIPTLSAMKIQVCPVPTAVLSTHMGYKSPAVEDLTTLMAQTREHWSNLDLKFDAIYTGFLASHEQITVVEDFIRRFAGENTLILVDPVMADHGSLYQCFDASFAEHMNKLTESAGLITPNLTEAALLLGEVYIDRPTDLKNYSEWAERLSEGKRDVVLTGVQCSEDRIGAIVYDVKKQESRVVQAPLVGQQYPGTGDLFASVLLGNMIQGRTLVQAAQQAVDFVSDCASYTLQAGTPPMEGVQLEALLSKLM